MPQFFGSWPTKRSHRYAAGFSNVFHSLDGSKIPSRRCQLSISEPKIYPILAFLTGVENKENGQSNPRIRARAVVIFFQYLCVIDGSYCVIDAVTVLDYGIDSHSAPVRLNP